ncbi:MAG: helix-turn-helix transcriptional regulator [Planctomycetota bacterium]
MISDMYRPKQLGSRLAELMSQRGVSPSATSKAAGLSRNYLRSVQRGLHRPSARVMAAISEALSLDEHEAAELRRLAGIDPDPAAAPEARKARRESWRPLVFILVNHVLLPRLELGDVHRRRRLSSADRELLTHAACASDMAAFVNETEASPPPGRGLVRFLEDVFSQVTPDLLRHINGHVRGAIDSRCPRGVRPSVPYRWDERTAIASTLLDYNRPSASEAALYGWIRSTSYDYNFAACFFPAAYWHTCKHWPFDKVRMPYARHGAEVQHELHSEIQQGLSLEDFDLALIGEGTLGRRLIASPPARPSPEDLSSTYGFKDEIVKLAYRRRGGTLLPELPRPPQDSLFDHLDRCELLERFPLIKIDRAGFADLARGLDLPSWRAWTKAAPVFEQAPEDVPPHSSERFAHVVSSVRVLGTMEDDRLSTLESHTARMLSQITAEAVARLLGKGDWQRFTQAAEVLELPDNWLCVAEAIARSTPPAQE